MDDTDDSCHEKDELEASLITEWPVKVTEKESRFHSNKRKGHTENLKKITNTGAVVGKKRNRQRENESAGTEPPGKTLKSLDALTADVALARWWRRHGRRLISPAVLPKTSNPNTVLNYVQRTDIAKEFLKGELKRLNILSQDASQALSTEDLAQLHLALASLHEKLGNLTEAKTEVKEALKFDSEDKDAAWLFEKLERQLQLKCMQQNQLKRLKLEADVPRKLPHYKTVARRSFKELSFKEFFAKYCKTSTPVVITDYLPFMTSTPWNWHHIKDKAGECNVDLKKFVAESVEWARLETAKTSKVAEFIDSVRGDGEGTEKLYLFDWSLPLHCPQLAHEIIIPRYFAGDFLQRTSPGSLYKDSWPSLFIAPKGVTTEVHIDAFGSNFWMALFEGRKRWVFFPRDNQPLLYPQYITSMDPVFDVNLDDPDLTQHPLLSLTEPMECILQPGELLFVPAGCPHKVDNLETSLALSGNFVDLSNFETVKEELRISALTEPRAADLLQQFNSESFVNKMSSHIGDLTWEQYKHWPPDSLDDYDLSS